MTFLSLEELLLQLHQLGIRLRAEAGQLVIQAPKGALTPTLREALAAHKARLLATLAPQAHAVPDEAVTNDAPTVVPVEAPAQPPAATCETSTPADTAAWSAEQQRLLTDRWSGLLTQGEALVAQLRQAHAAELQEHERVCADLNRLSVLAMLLALVRLGAFRPSGAGITAQRVVQAAGLAPRQAIVIRQWLRTLADAGHLQSSNGDYFPDPALDLPAVQQAFDRLQAGIRSTAPYAPFVEHIKTCAARQVELLRGTEDPFTLLFPGGGFDVALAHYRDTPVVRLNNHVLAALARSALDQRLEAAAPATVLELGAGCGATTEAVLAALHDRTARYVVTDIGDFFLRRAAQQLRPGPSVSLAFQRFDLAQDPLEQGIADQSVDLIVAVNVVHNARHVEQALRRLRTALKPGGLLLLSEQTENSPLNQVNFAHFESFGHYQDRRLQLDSPLMPAADWMQAFEAAGFTRCAAVPAAQPTPPNSPDVGRQRVLLAEAPPTRSTP